MPDRLSFDSGLVCALLQIREPGQLRLQPLRGAIIESWAVAELYKALAHRGEQPLLYHYRESRGLEVDILVLRGNMLHAVEIKSGAKAASDFFKGFEPFAERMRGAGFAGEIANAVIYGGDTSQRWSVARLVGWRDVGGFFAGAEAAE